MNPPLPDVLAVRRTPDTDQVNIDLHVPAGLAHFAGHFPGLAILPGVVQIDWAVHFAREHFALDGEFTMLENIKFQAIVLPDARLELLLNWNAENRYLEFAFSGKTQKYSHGRLVFGGGL